MKNQENMNYIPTNNRLIVKVVNTEFEKTAGGILVDNTSTNTASKNNLIRAVIVKVGNNCEAFKKEQEGLMVLIHEVGGVPMDGVDPSLRILREDDIWAYSTDAPPEEIKLEEVHKQSEFSKTVDRNSV
jgi:co-chaperonin GroES (HSP10)